MIFGVGWIFLQPVALTVIFTYIFRRFTQISSGGAPYPLFTAIGLVAWSLTALVVNTSTISLIGNSSLLKRGALPRILLPLSTVVAALADLAVMGLLLIALIVYYQMPCSWTLGWVPV